MEPLVLLVPKETLVTLEKQVLKETLVTLDCREWQDHLDHREVLGLKERKVHEDLQQLLWVELHTTGGVILTVALKHNLCMLEGLEVAFMSTKVVLQTTYACPMTHNTHNTNLECVITATCMELNMKSLLCLVAVNTMLHVLCATFLQDTQLS